MSRPAGPRHIPFAVITCLVLAAACGSPGTRSSAATSKAEAAEPLDWNVHGPAKKTTGHPVRVRYVAYLSQQNLEIVNESHSDPHDLYSKKLSVNAVKPKVQTDEVMEALLERFAELGATKRFQPGAAPATAPSRAAQALEVETEAGVKCWVVRETSPEAERAEFRGVVSDFVNLYNSTVQYQSVDEAPAWRGAQGTQLVRPPNHAKPSSGSGKVQ